MTRFQVPRDDLGTVPGLPQAPRSVDTGARLPSVTSAREFLVSRGLERSSRRHSA
jgi:hypothetical protein